MGISNKDSASNNYELKEIQTDELGKTFVYDRVEDNIDETPSWNKMYFVAKAAKAAKAKMASRYRMASWCLILLSTLLAIITRVSTREIRVYSPSQPTPGQLDPSEFISSKSTERSLTLPEQKKISNPNIGILKKSLTFSDRLTSQDGRSIYYFTIDRPSYVSIYLYNGTNRLGMILYVDINGNKAIDSEDRGRYMALPSSYSVGKIQEILAPANYILVIEEITKEKGRNTNYTVTMMVQ